MARYALRRLIAAIPVIILMTLMVFSVTYLIPGDPAQVLLGPADISPEVYEAVREQMGLNEPFLSRYLIWLLNIGRGDLGYSYLSRQPVTVLLGRALPVTFQLMVFSLAIALAIAIPAALISALWRGSWLDTLVTPLSFVGLSLPRFWLALGLIYLFAVRLRWLPASGFTPISEDLGANLRSMVLPSLTLGILLSTGLTRFLRANLIDASIQDYVRTAQMKGIPTRQVVIRHIFKNGWLPFMTVLGLEAALLLGGTVLIEDVFALPGMGRLALQAILLRDYLVVQGVVLTLGLLFVLINLAVDLIYAILDPRIRLEAERAEG